MTARRGTVALLVGAAVFVAVGLFLAGRATVHAPSPRDTGYADGLRAGEAQGRQEGRALQESVSVSAGARQRVQDAFDDGYAAGAEDTFAGYDGGWALATPYVITLEHGGGHITYRISSRTAVRPGVDYYLCADGHSVCSRPHH